ncbi:MAG: elongation factor G [Candidatus Eiseniibacteriota bacterium]
MKEYTTSQIRNIALFSHGGAGKTSLAEAMLFAARATNRLGRIEDGTTALDYGPDEVHRKITINLGLAQFEWKNTKINLLDTPGYADFVGEVYSALRAVDAAVLVLRAAAGVEVGTELVWERIHEHHIPTLLVVNMMDKEHADFAKCVKSAHDRLGANVVPVQLPIGSAETFKGVIDLLHMKAYLTQGRGVDAKDVEEEIPADMKDEAEKARAVLVEEAASNDETLMQKFFDGEALTEDEVIHGLEKGVASGKLIPAFAASATTMIGVRDVLDDMVGLIPPPDEHPEEVGVRPGTDQPVARHPDEKEPFSAVVFKTVSEAHLGELSLFRVFSGSVQAGAEVLNANTGKPERVGTLYNLVGKERKETGRVVAGDIAGAVKLKETHTGNTLCDRGQPVLLPGVDFPQHLVTEGIRPKAKGDEEKIGVAFQRLHEEDPTVRIEVDPGNKQTLIRGLGDLQLDVVVDRLKSRFHVEVELFKPRVPYRETIKRTAQGEYRHKKQTGGRGQFGEVHLRLEPNHGKGYEFLDEIKGGVVPNQYIPAVDKGLKEAMDSGVMAGYPVVDVKAALFFGKYHDVDSSEMAFKIAAIQCFKEVAEKAGPVLLEPIDEVEVRVPEEFMGDVMGDLSSKRGKILGMDSQGHYQLIRALVPEAEMYKYASHLRSITQGRGTYRMKFDHYEEVPRDQSEKIVAAARAEKEAEARA